MHFNIGTCLKGSIIFHHYRLQTISTVYKRTKTLNKYNTCSILIEEGNKAAVKR